eukprot:UN03199
MLGCDKFFFAEFYPSCQNKIPPPEPLFQKPRLRKNFMLKRGVQRTEPPENILPYFRCVYNDFYKFYVNGEVSTIVNLACENIECTVGEALRKNFPIYLCIFYVLYHLAYFLCNIFV